MDWDFAIKRKRRELGAVIATLLAMVAACVSRDGRNALLRILRPAESAVRRLIVIYARQKQTALPKAQSAAPLPDFSGFGPSQTDRKPSFRLIDPRKRFGPVRDAIEKTDWQGPRIWTLGMVTPHAGTAVVGAKPEQALDVTTLQRRVAALDHALKTLPAQARRLNRMMARREQAPPGPGRVGPIRPGLPPGYRRQPEHAIEGILADCHAMVVDHVVSPP